MIIFSVCISVLILLLVTGDFTIEMFLYNEETAGKGFIQLSELGGLKNTNVRCCYYGQVDLGQNGVLLVPKMLPLLFQTQFHIRGGVMLH